MYSLSTEKKYSSKYEYKHEYGYSIPAWHVSLGFMKEAEFVKYGLNKASFNVMNKASNMGMSVSLFINFH